MNRLSLLIAAVFVFMLSCKKDDENNASNQDTTPSGYTYSVINYTESYGGSDVLISGTTENETGNTMYSYGDTDQNGIPINVSHIEYHEAGNDTIIRTVLDENYLITSMYYLVNGVKSNDLIRFTYPEPNKMGVIISDYNWETGEETVEKFAIADITGDNPQVYYLRMGGWYPGAQAVANAFFNVVSVVATVGLVYLGSTIGTSTAAAGAIILVLGFTSNASASETPISQANGEQPTQISNTENPVDPCQGSGLTVTVGVDPGNVLVALATGSSSPTFSFYWSTGEEGSGSVYHSITATESGDYFVLVIDEYGCYTVGSATIGGSPTQELIDGSPWRSSSFGDGSYEIMRIYGEDCSCWTDSTFNALDEVIADHSYCFSYDTDSLYYLNNSASCPSLSGTSFKVTSINGNTFTCLKNGQPVTYTSLQ